MADFIENTKGNHILCQDGFLYTKNKTFPNGNSYWECRERRSGNGAGRDCLAKITRDPNDQVIKLSEPHTHPADPEKLPFYGRALAWKEQQKTTPNTTQNILTTNIAGLSAAVMARLPTAETLRREIR